LCKAINPGARIFVAPRGIGELDEMALSPVDVVMLATDHLAPEVELGQRCLWLGRPLVQASVHGETLLAQVRTFSNRAADHPCPPCGFGIDEWSLLSRQTVFSCAGPDTSRPGWVGRSELSAPTMSISALCAIAAELAVIQVLRLVLGLGAPVGDDLVQYCGFR